MSSEWIPCKVTLPPNEGGKWAACPMYLVSTTWGVTQGWFNPYDGKDGAWHVLMWFFSGAYTEEDINFAKGDKPKAMKVSREHVKAWMPLPEPWKEDLDE